MYTGQIGFATDRSRRQNQDPRPARSFLRSSLQLVYPITYHHKGLVWSACKALAFIRPRAFSLDESMPLPLMKSGRCPVLSLCVTQDRDLDIVSVPPDCTGQGLVTQRSAVLDTLY